MNSPRKIGVIGGMGPEATILLMQRILAATPASGDADHVPMIVDNNPQVPSCIDAIINGADIDPGLVIAGMARGLATAGAEALVMPCNTAHFYNEDFLSSVDIPLLNMLTLSVDAVTHVVGTEGRIGLLASPAVRKVKLFDDLFERCGVKIHHPTDDAALLGAVQAIKNAGPDGKWKKLSQAHRAQ